MRFLFTHIEYILQYNADDWDEPEYNSNKGPMHLAPFDQALQDPYGSKITILNSTFHSHASLKS